MLISRAKTALAQSKIDTAALDWCAGIAKVEVPLGSCEGERESIVLVRVPFQGSFNPAAELQPLFM